MINVNSNFHLGSKDFLDSRQSVETLDDLLALDENIIPDGHKCYVHEKDAEYKFNSNYNETDTGHWKLNTSEGGEKQGEFFTQEQYDQLKSEGLIELDKNYYVYNDEDVLNGINGAGETMVFNNQESDTAKWFKITTAPQASGKSYTVNMYAQRINATGHIEYVSVTRNGDNHNYTSNIVMQEKMSSGILPSEDVANYLVVDANNELWLKVASYSYAYVNLISPNYAGTFVIDGTEGVPIEDYKLDMFAKRGSNNFVTQEEIEILKKSVSEKCIIKENENNAENIYMLDVETENTSFTTPNLIATDTYSILESSPYKFKIDIDLARFDRQGYLIFRHGNANSISDVAIYITPNDVYYSSIIGRNRIESLTYTRESGNTTHITIGIKTKGSIYGLQQLFVDNKFATVNSFETVSEEYIGEKTANYRSNQFIDSKELRHICINLGDTALQSTGTSLQKVSLADYIDGSVYVTKVDGYIIPPADNTSYGEKGVVTVTDEERMGAVGYENGNWYITIPSRSVSSNKCKGYANIYYTV